MERSEMNQLQVEITETAKALMQKKGADYANEDILSNFKRMQQACAIFRIRPDLRSADCAHFLELLKFDRLRNLIAEGRSPENESVGDTVVDKLNYNFLGYGCLLDDWKDKQIKDVVDSTIEAYEKKLRAVVEVQQ